jgi:hypothetical protein
MNTVSLWPAASLALAILDVSTAAMTITLLGLRFFQADLEFRSHKGRLGVSIVFALFISVWAAAALSLGSGGFFSSAPDSRVPLIAWALLPFAVLFVFWGLPAFRQLVAVIPSWWLVAIQTVRVAGLTFLVTFAFGQMPGEFALPAGIGDVLVGLDAPFVAWAMRRNHRNALRWGVAWNIFGIADLVVALTTGMLTSPGRAHILAVNNPNMLITQFPYVIIPTLMVPLLLFVHFLSLQKIASASRGQK